MEEIIRLRHELHRHPELSGRESATGKRIRFFLNRYRPDILFTGIAGEGMAAVFNGTEPGPTLLFRCDMDALPIHEAIQRPYSSKVPGVAHVCGHDGHMSIVSGLAKSIIENPIRKGKVILLYQPEEENGQGAVKSIRRLREINLSPDLAFAIHNMPKYPMGSIIISDNSFASASKGIVVKLTGKSSHAAFPENGINPSLAIAEIVQGLERINQSSNFIDFTLVTIIYIRVGEIAFGTSPGFGEMMATLRAFRDADMKILTDNALDLIRGVGNKHGLVVETSFDDDFPATVNDPKLTKIVAQLAKKMERRVIKLKEPNRWSEDFAHFTVRGPAILIGLGVGEDIPDLHSPDFDFPDEALSLGIKTLDTLITHFLR
jgi:amidohydrolase